MKNIALLTAVLLAAAPSARAAAPGWTLAWSDEFDGPAGTTPDPAKWVHAVGRDHDGWGNQELESYCAPGSAAPCDPAKPNAVLDGRGNLAVSARLSSGTWTSARLNTQGLADFRFGRVEARMRLPTGAGLWPAFWMIGTDIPAVGWPACGEIDMMENVPAGVPGGLGPDRIKGTLHGPGYSGVHGVGRVRAFPGGGRVDDGFHTYGAVWSPGKVAFFVDDASKPYFTATRKDLPKGKAWVFDKPFFLIMNLAVGGSWPKDPDASTPDPATMLVDWVRVYRRAR